MPEPVDRIAAIAAEIEAALREGLEGVDVLKRVNERRAGLNLDWPGFLAAMEHLQAKVGDDRLADAFAGKRKF
ncbi:hypothetical protein ACQVP2_07410 [Methylobacterium aquaticum]|uniref:hypothetical protein n=1 Tax=Methylobacterium aquaticum TaxID=270351 RepID=UPI003D1665DD